MTFTDIAPMGSRETHTGQDLKERFRQMMNDERELIAFTEEERADMFQHSAKEILSCLFTFDTQRKVLDALSPFRPQEILSLCNAMKDLSMLERAETWGTIYRYLDQRSQMDFLSVWIRQDASAVENIEQLPDALFEGDLSTKAVDLLEFKPFDNETQGASINNRIPIIHQLPASLLVGIGFHSGLGPGLYQNHEYQPDNAPTVFTHPLVKHWFPPFGQDDLPPPFFESDTSHFHETSLNTGMRMIFKQYPALFEFICNELEGLQARFPSSLIFVRSDQPDFVRFSRILDPDLQVSPETRAFGEASANALGRVVDFMRQKGTGKLEQSEFGMVAGVSDDNIHDMVRNFLRSFVFPAQPTSPSFYDPSFGLLMDVSTDLLPSDWYDRRTKKEQMGGNGLHIDDIGSFIFPPRGNGEPTIPLEHIHGIVVMTDHIPSETAAAYLVEIIRALKLSFFDKPSQAIPIFNARGDMLWPKRLDRDEVRKLSK